MRVMPCILYKLGVQNKALVMRARSKEQRDVWSRGGKIVDRPPNKLSVRVKSFSTHSPPPRTPSTKHKPMRKYTTLRVCFFFIICIAVEAREENIKFRAREKKGGGSRELTNKREFV
jgi:hypothetical protein